MGTCLVQVKSMKLENQLHPHKIIKFYEKIDFSQELKNISDKTILKARKKDLSLVEVYRFIYTISKKKVVGFVSMPKSGENFPCLIHLRGGSGEFGQLNNAMILQELVRFSREGYVVITTQYPGVDGGEGIDAFGGEDDIASIIKLKDILKTLSCADSTKIGVKGHSRGGLMAYMLLREVSWVKCAVIGSAPVDQIAQAKERKGWREHQIKMWGKSKEESVKRSPLFWIDTISKKVPLLIMHGSADWRVSVTHSQRMSLSLYQAPIPHRFVLFEGADHGITEYKNEYVQQTLSWFDRFLKKGESLPNLEMHGR